MALTHRPFARTSAVRNGRHGRLASLATWRLTGALALALSVLAATLAPSALDAQTPSATPSSPLPRPDGARTVPVAQSVRTVGAETPDATRDELQVALAGLERAGKGSTPAASAIRTRLASGDLRPGDRFVMTLSTDSVVQRELVVRDSIVVDLPPLASLPVRGLLRTELQPALLRHMRRYYRSPEVRVQFLTRLGVLGAVGKPGYLVVTPDATLNDVLQAAGGPVQNAKLGEITLWRHDRRLLDKKGFSNQLRAGRTLAELDVRSGDEIRVPAKSGRSWVDYVWPVSLVISTIFSILFLIRSVNSY
jgi:protein involved in polysaccharide export with SLBB domain